MLTRAQLGLAPRRGATTWPARSPRGAVAHWAGGQHMRPDRTTAEYANTWRAIQRMHQAPGGLGTADGATDIAYSFGITPTGLIFEGRGWNVRSGANGDSWANTHLAAACYLGGPGTGFTPAAQTAWRELDRQMRARWPHFTGWTPHRQWTGSACPGDTIIRWLPTLDQPAPPPAPDVHDQEEDEIVQIFVRGRGDPAVYLTDGIHKRHVTAEELRGYAFAKVGRLGHNGQPIEVPLTWIDSLETVGRRYPRTR